MKRPDSLAIWLDQPVAVFGGGASGRGVTALLRVMGAKGTIFDQKSTISGVVNNFDAREAARHRLVVYSPGFNPGHLWLKTAREAGCECLAELDFAWSGWRGAVVAVTGTNGKTTLTEFLTHALAAGGATVFATGNIGYSFSQLVAETDGGSAGSTAVCEVSSFQAETLQRFRADATLWTNFAEDHLERHPGMDAYFAAKWNLVSRTAPGGLRVGSSVAHFAAQSGRALPSGASVVSEGKSTDLRLSGTIFSTYPQYENFLLAEAWWLSAGRSEAALIDAARTFKPGRHRLSAVAEFEGVTWWNDSKATNFHAVEAALASFDAPVLLIAGGKSKGGDISGFVRRIRPRVSRLFLIGETETELAEACREHGVPYTTSHDLARAVQDASATARPGQHVLLSPAFASFDQFRSYEDRGNQFETHVNNLGITATFR